MTPEQKIAQCNKNIYSLLWKTRWMVDANSRLVTKKRLRQFRKWERAHHRWTNKSRPVAVRRWIKRQSKYNSGCGVL